MEMTEHDMDRRGFLKVAGLATVAGMVGAGPALAGKPARSAEPLTRVQRRLKTVRYAMSGKMSSSDLADPAFNTSQHDGRLISAAYEQLSRYDEALRARPQLAQRWEPNAKADVWTFRLRRGVRFHDGSRLTAKDVVYSFRRLLDPKTASPGAGSLSFLDPDGIRAVGDYTVRFRLAQPNADLPLSLITRQSYIVPDGATKDDLRREAVGTGPFRVKDFDPGRGPTIFEKNKRYWGAMAKSDVLRLVSISEPAARVAALKRGQVDIIEDPPGTELASLKRGPGTRIVTQVKGNMEVIAMQIDVEPFNDVRVRQALKYAMDRRRMLQLVAQGNGILVNDIPIASILEFSVPGAPRARNVARAKTLLKQAGHDDGLKVTLSVSDVQARFIEIATVYKSMATEADIDVELDIGPGDTYWDNVWLKRPMFVSAWIARPTDAMLALILHSKADWNETHWRRARWDARLATARRTLSYKKRQAIYRSLQKEVIEQGGYLVPYMVNTIDATRASVRGWKPSGTPFANFAPIDFTS
jgi:peptide/nickel transport system substrate-binding protein